MPLIEYKKRSSKIKSKKTLDNKVESTIKHLVVTLAVIIVGLGVVFLTSTSKTTQKGYALQQEKLRNEDLKTLNESLSNQITNATTSINLEDSEKVENMAETEDRTYVTKEDNEVAR